jgi:hypothetical protein
VHTDVKLVAVNTDEEAQQLRFPGSPTIRVDGDDLFPVPEREVWALGCRTYLTPEGLKGWPTPQMLRDALEAKGATHANGTLQGRSARAGGPARPRRCRAPNRSRGHLTLLVQER